MNLKDLIAKKKLAEGQEYAPLPLSLPLSLPLPLPVESLTPAPEKKIEKIEKKGKRSFAEIMEEKKKAKEAALLAKDPSLLLSSSLQTEASLYETAKATILEQEEGTVDATIASKKESFSLNITLNARQLLAKDMALAGKSFCLIGPAGTGKTTTQRAVAEQLLQDKRLGETTFKVQGMPGARVNAPSIAFIAYTRRAAANLERAIHKLPELEEALRCNIMTAHALLEYQPVFFYDDEKEKESMRFEPQRHALNPLDITHLVIEESSMVGLDLWDKIYAALRPGVQIIYIGDINQLPPVFGPSILNYALTQLPVVELDTVYRQAEDSSIIENAHRILAGKMVEEAPDFQIMEGTKQHGQFKMAMALGKIFRDWYNQGIYDPEQDMILSPFNKQDMGTTSMNNWIAQFLGEKRNAKVYEVIAGFSKLYLAVGDRVMFNKRDAIITAITHNTGYMGKSPQLPSEHLTRFGSYNGNGQGDDLDLDSTGISYENFSLESLSSEEVERKQQSSHTVDIAYLDGDMTDTLYNAGEFAPAIFSLGYVLTVHKAQGCEWRKVFFLQHKDHNIMNYRELIYTAITRAREELIWIAKRPYIQQGINKPRIKGNTIADKIEYFNANMNLDNSVLCVKE